MPGFIDITGQRFGKWTVLERAANYKYGQARWICRCTCGREAIVHGNSLRSGDSRRCKSCHNRNINTTHGQTGTRLYHIWNDMIQRCENANDKSYKYYGGRGISICQEWRKGFVAFRNWALANGYREGLTIDRINNDGNYEPSNCRFVTRKEQCQNRRKPDYFKAGAKVNAA